MKKILIEKNLYFIRKKNFMTQQNVSDIFDITRQCYSNYENGKRKPTLRFLVDFSEYFNISLDDLILKEIKLTDNLGLLPKEK